MTPDHRTHSHRRSAARRTAPSSLAPRCAMAKAPSPIAAPTSGRVAEAWSPAKRRRVDVAEAHSARILARVHDHLARAISARAESVPIIGAPPTLTASPPPSRAARASARPHPPSRLPVGCPRRLPECRTARLGSSCRSHDCLRFPRTPTSSVRDRSTIRSRGVKPTRHDVHACPGVPPSPGCKTSSWIAWRTRGQPPRLPSRAGPAPGRHACSW